MIEKGATAWNEGLLYACRGGHLNLVELMIEKGANYLNWGLEYCKDGHLDIVQLLIEKGATSMPYWV
jgi:ankyrin repeat protein